MRSAPFLMPAIVALATSLGCTPTVRARHGINGCGLEGGHLPNMPRAMAYAHDPSTTQREEKASVASSSPSSAGSWEQRVQPRRCDAVLVPSPSERIRSTVAVQLSDAVLESDRLKCTVHLRSNWPRPIEINGAELDYELPRQFVFVHCNGDETAFIYHRYRDNYHYLFPTLPHRSLILQPKERKSFIVEADWSDGGHYQLVVADSSMDGEKRECPKLPGGRWTLYWAGQIEFTPIDDNAWLILPAQTVSVSRNAIVCDVVP